MLSGLIQRIKHIDKWIFIPYFILSCLSIVFIYSASAYNVSAENPNYYLIQQARLVGFGFVAAFVGAIIPFELLKKKSIVMLAMGAVGILLLLVNLRGVEEYGAQRWYEIPIINQRIQPSEIAKFVIIWYFAYIFSRKQRKIANDFFKALVAPCMLVAVFIYLIFIQPDLGSSVIITATGAFMIFASGISPIVGISFSVFGTVGIIGLFRLVRVLGTRMPLLRDYQYDRFLGFWDPFEVSETFGNQLVNSYYALSNGGIFGVGIGNSIQKTGYLPFPHTDFIMAIVAEEVGLLGILAVIGLFTLLVSRMFLMGIRARDSFDSLLCIGIASLFMIQGFVNLGGVIGMMPITGITFPLISYGGTSLMISTFSIGLVANVSARVNLQKAGASESNQA